MLAGSAQRVPLEGLRSTVKSAVEGLSQAPRELAMAHQNVKGVYSMMDGDETTGGDLLRRRPSIPLT